jgi:tetratricopeptide (TPR) repeat protein
MGGLLLLGLGVYAYLPLRAATHPPVDWGHPATLKLLLAHLMRAQLHGLGDNPRDVSALAGQIARLFRLIGQQFTPMLAALALPGIYSLWRRSRRLCMLLVGVFIAGGPVVAGLQNAGLAAGELDTVRPWYLVAYAVWAVWMACGAVALWNWSTVWLGWERARQPRSLVATGAAVLLVVPLLAWSLRVNQRRGDFVAYDFARCLLDTMEPKAVLFGRSDAYALPVMYLQVVEGRRSDVTNAMPYRHVDPSLYRDLPDKLPRLFPPSAPHLMAQAVEEWVVQRYSRTRPIYFSEPAGMPKVPGSIPQVEGLLWRLVPAGNEQEASRVAERSRLLLSQYRIRGLDRGPNAGYFSRQVAMYWGRARAEQYLQDRNLPAGLATWDQALAGLEQFDWPYVSAAFLVQAAAARPGWGDRDRELLTGRALLYIGHAASLDPGRVEVLVQQARALGALKHWDEAITALETALTSDHPQFRYVPRGEVIRLLALAHRERGFSRLQQGQAHAAAFDFREARRLWPNQPPLPDPLAKQPPTSPPGPTPEAGAPQGEP